MVIGCLSVAILSLAQSTDSVPKLGVYEGRTIEYIESNGMAIVEGDIVLGPVSLVQPAGSATEAKRPQSAVLRPTLSSLWPKTTNGVAEIPYKMFGHGASDNLSTALAIFNSTFQGVVRFVPNGGNRADYVNFRLEEPSAFGCTGNSSIGRKGGEQFVTIKGADCVATILHELGHVAGLLHEHTRRDRGQHILINWRTISETNRSEYRTALDAEDAGSFDYSSIMIYNNFSFVALDRHIPAIETIPPGVPLLKKSRQQEWKEYSDTDIATLRKLYGSSEKDASVTAVSNPPGFRLQIERMFGETVLDVKRDKDGYPTYVDENNDLWLFARWSDLVSGTPVPYPDPRRVVPNSPAIYIANFVRLKPLGIWGGLANAPTVEPVGAGTVQVLASPITLGDVRYRVADTLVTLRASPAPGYLFHSWKTLVTDVGMNPRRVNPDLYTMPVACFVRKIALRIETDPPGLNVKVDNKLYAGSRNFAASGEGNDLDGPTWTSGSTHSLSVAQVQPSQVEDAEAILRFQSWSSSQSDDPLFEPGKLLTQSRANGQTITARYVHAYTIKAVTATEPPNCAVEQLVTNPPAVNLRYNEGSDVALELRLKPGWNAIGWNPPLENNKIKVTGTMRPIAVVNTNPEPLVFRNLDPPTAAVGSTSIEVVGSGFDASTRYCLFKASEALGCDAPSEFSPTRLRVALPPTYTSSPGTLQMEVRNGFQQQPSCEVRSARLSFEIR